MVEDLKKVSIIIVGRNEQLHIERCVCSVIKGIQKFPQSEIIFVDSASTDKTSDLVRLYPVQIYQLRSDWPLSASAGRYIGYLHAQGDYLFFIDGDTLLFHDWLEKGIQYLQDHPQVGVVAGSVHEIFENENGERLGFLQHRYGIQKEPRQEKTMGGIALYRKSILDQVGPFNPFIAADEEPELGFRIRRAGYTLMRLPDPMAITYGPARDTVRELFRRYHRKLFSFGTTLRYCQQNRFFWKYIFERLDHLVTYALAMFVLLIISIFAIMWGVFHYVLMAGIVSGIFIRIFFPALFRRLLISFVKRSLMMIRTVQSYIQTKPKSIDQYPTDVIAISSKAKP